MTASCGTKFSSFREPASGLTPTQVFMGCRDKPGNDDWGSESPKLTDDRRQLSRSFVGACVVCRKACCPSRIRPRARIQGWVRNFALGRSYEPRNNELVLKGRTSDKSRAVTILPVSDP